MTREQLERGLDRAKYDTRGTDMKAMAVLLDRLFAFGRAFNIPTPAKGATAEYDEALRNYPPDLLEIAINRARQDWKWGNRLPMPGDLKEFITQEASERAARLAKLQHALDTAPEPDEERERPPEQVAAVRSLVAECTRNLNMQEAARREALRKKDSTS